MTVDNSDRRFKPNVSRLGAVTIIIAILLTCVAFKYVKICLFDSKKFITVNAANNEAFAIPAERGEIWDRNSVPLVKNVLSPYVFCEPRQIKNKGGIPDGKGGFVDLQGKPTTEGTANILSAVLGTDIRETLKAVVGDKDNQAFNYIKLHLDPGTAEKLKQFNLKGVYFRDSHKRFYPQGNLAMNLLGETEPYEQNGVEGIEGAFNDELKGVTGLKTYSRDAQVNGAENYIIDKPAKHGDFLILTIDSTIQFIAQQRMTEAMNHWDADAAICVVQDPRTGEILAAAQSVRKGLEKRYPLNLPMSYQFEPGSVFKGVTTAIGLDCGAIDENIKLSDNGGIRVGDVIFRCDWISSRGHGLQNLVQAIRNSCNVVFVQYGQRIIKKIGGQKFFQKLLQFGFGSEPGTGLPEDKGGVQTPDMWYSSSPWNMFFGRGITVTPLQLINAYSAIANGGVLMKPMIIKAKYDPNTRKKTEEIAQTLRPVVSPQAAERTMKALTQNVIADNYDTVYKAAMKGYDIAGKTGTANQINPDGGYYDNARTGIRYNCSFIGMLPSDANAAQKLSILVTVVNPKNTYDGVMLVGSNVAAPYFRLVAEDITSLLRIGPKDEVKKPAPKSTH